MKNKTLYFKITSKRDVNLLGLRRLIYNFIVALSRDGLSQRETSLDADATFATKTCSTELEPKPLMSLS